MADPTRPEPTPRDVEVAREIREAGFSSRTPLEAAIVLARYREEIEAPLRGDLADWKESAHAKDEIVAEVEAVAARNLVLTEERDYARQSEERLREELANAQAVITQARYSLLECGFTPDRPLITWMDRALLAPAGGPDSAPPAAERGTEQRWCRYCTQGIPLEQDANGLFHRGANYSGTRERRLFCTAPPPAPVQPANSSGSGANLNNLAGSASKLNDQPAERAETREHVCGLSGYNGMIDPPCPGPGHSPAPPPGTTQEEREQGEARYCMTCATIHRPDECWDPEER